MDEQTLLGDPRWLAHRYVETGDAFRFVHLTRADHAGLPFLSEAHLAERAPGGDVATAHCLALPADPPLHFLFHTAFCGSTTLVRALDAPGLAMGLSEPQVLNDVVGLRRRGADPRAVARTADAATRLLGRPFGAAGPGPEPVIVKPSNVINPLAALLLALRAEARAVFLYAPLETYLISVARKGLHCRAWVRELLEGFVRDGELAGMGLDSADLFRLTDLQVAAVGWLIQHRLIHRLADRVGPARLATLDGDRMFADPEAALARVAAHYGLPVTDAQIRAMATGPAFGTQVKSGAAYSPAARDRDYAAVRAAHGEEIDMVTVWARAVAETAGIAFEAPAALLQA